MIMLLVMMMMMMMMMIMIMTMVGLNILRMVGGKYCDDLTSVTD